MSPGFFHNGAYTNARDAIRFHLNVVEEAREYEPEDNVPADMRQVGPLVPKRLIHPSLRKPIKLTNQEFKDLVRFVKDGLLDERVRKSNLCGLDPRHRAQRIAGGAFRGLQPVTRVPADNEFTAVLPAACICGGGRRPPGPALHF